MNRLSNLLKGILLLLIIIIGYNSILFYSFPDEISYTNTLAFKNQDKNSINYIFLGSSHVYKGIIPEVLDYNLNVNSYDYATSNNVIEYNYLQIKEILKTQKPDYIFLDLFNFIDRTDDDVAMHKAIDTIRLSPLKYKTVKLNLNEESIKEMLVPIIKYHLEWKSEDISKKISYRMKIKSENTHRGYEFTTEQFSDEKDPIDDLITTDEKLYLPDDRQKILNDIINLCNKNDVELVFFCTPFIDSDLFPMSELQAYKNGLIELYPDINIIDLNMYYDEIGLVKSDFYDIGHLNVFGAYKTTMFLSEYLKNNDFKTNLISTEDMERNEVIYKEFYDKYLDALNTY